MVFFIENREGTGKEGGRQREAEIHRERETVRGGGDTSLPPSNTPGGGGRHGRLRKGSGNSRAGEGRETGKQAAVSRNPLPPLFGTNISPVKSETL